MRKGNNKKSKAETLCIGKTAFKPLMFSDETSLSDFLNDQFSFISFDNRTTIVSHYPSANSDNSACHRLDSYDKTSPHALMKEDFFCSHRPLLSDEALGLIHVGSKLNMPGVMKIQVIQDPCGAVVASVDKLMDGVILVFDGESGEIRHHLSMFNKHDAKKKDSGIDLYTGEVVKYTDLQEKDILLHFRGNYWNKTSNEKQALERIESSSFIALSVTEAPLAVISRVVKEHLNASVDEIGRKVLEALIALNFSKREKLQNLKKVFSSLLNVCQEEEKDLSFFFDLLKEKSGKDEFFLKECFNKLREKKIIEAEKTSIKTLLNFLDKIEFSDCVDLAIMQARHYKKELICTIMEIRRLKNKKNLLRYMLTLVRKAKISCEDLKLITDELLREKHLVCIGEDYRYSDFDKGREQKYTKEECDSLSRMLAADKDISALIENSMGKGKSALLQALKDKVMLSDKPLSLSQISEIFNNCDLRKEDFNSHKNKYWDMFFGLKNTKSWSKTVKEIRHFSLQKLFKEVNDKKTSEEKLFLLRHAKKESLFNLPRGNGLFAVLGKTNAVRLIDKECVKLKKGIRSSSI